MQRVFKQIALAAPSDVPVLITGESGTGKELVAQALHRHGLDPEKPFVPVCVPALNPSLVEAELFGHRKGAFTGAESDRVGLLEEAQGGTVFLDEIGEVPLGLQVKLLRALEHGEVIRVGDSQPRRVNFRLVAATNRDLAGAIRAGEFREDLYYRLAVFPVELPALRERTEDIPSLAAHFLAGAGGRATEFTDDAIAELRSRRWAGNVRELRNVIERAALLARGDRIGPDLFPEPLPVEQADVTDPAERLREAVRQWAVDAGDEAIHEAFLAATEPELFRWAMEQSGNNRMAAAKLLGIHRATLRQKCRQYGMDS